MLAVLAPRVARPLVLLLLAMPLALLGLALSPNAAFACSCVQLTLKQQINRAEAVFTAQVTDVATPVGAELVYPVDAERVYKGELTSSTAEIRTAASPATCGLGQLTPGETYLFLTSGGATNVCDGSAPADAMVMERVQRLVGIGERVEPPAPAAATRTPVEGAAPPSFARIAAPGAAMVLVGLLGLAVVRRVGRG